ncbi:MAG: ABC transporter transmembrane domain-containing protein, partial [Flavobacteriales bacterium]
MSKAGGKAFDFGVLKRVLRYVRPYRSLFVGSIFLTVLLAIIGIVRTELLGYLIDFTTGNHTVRPFPGLVDLFEGLTQGKTSVVALNVVTLVIVFILIAEVFFQYFQMLMANRVAQSVTIDLRTSLFSHLLRFRLKFFDTTPIGT